uniref:Putative salivary lipocalin n=1 Tax=Ixodes ricinus TaxID=34613 RepID=A0A0K8R4P9_IXORI
MPLCLQCGACQLLLGCIGFFLATTATAATPAQNGIPVDASKMLGAVHGIMFDFQFKSSDYFMLIDSNPTCLTIQFLFSEEGVNSLGELWVHYKTSDTKRHVDRIPLKFKDATESTLGNTLMFEFPKPPQLGHISKEVEFQVREHNSCYSLKATTSGNCFIIVFLTSSQDSRANDCVPQDELENCQYENYETFKNVRCLEYEQVSNSAPREVKEATPQCTPDNAPDRGPKEVEEGTALTLPDYTPLDETNLLLQRYQDFPKGLLFGSLVLVYSSWAEDPFRLCKITYRPNEEPQPHGKLYILTTGKTQKEGIVQAFHPHHVDGHNCRYKATAEIYRNGKFYWTKVIYTDRKRCTILRTPGYNNLCELFTAGHYTSGSLNSYCFFVYTMYCKEPATTFTKLGDCWPPARQPNP